MRELLTKRELFEAVADMIVDEVLIYVPEEDCCTIYKVSEKALEVMEVIFNWKKWLYHNSDKTSHEVLDKMFEAINGGIQKAVYEIKVKKKPTDSEMIWINCCLKAVPGRGFYIGVVKRTDERTGENLKLYEEARKDSLTKLINKAYSTQLITDAMKKTKKGTLLIVDIDNFKSVNDNMGHLFGDEVIVSVANGLKSVFRTEDIVGRIGGDEFIVFLEGLVDRKIIQRKAEAVCDTVSNIYTGENAQVKISASVGIAVMPDDGEHYNELFKKADHALYYTKNKGKNGYSFFDEKNEEMQNHHRMAVKTRELASEDEEVNQEMDTFYFELNELAFRMLEETRDTNSAVNLILHKIQDKFGFSFIRIFEPETKEKELVCTYEVCASNVGSVIGKRYVYNESEWIRLKSHCNSEAYVYKKSEAEPGEEDIFKSSDTVKSGVLVSVSSNNCFSGMITFVDCSRERGFSGKELKVLKSFERVFSVYKVQENSFANTDYHLKQLTERDILTGLYKYSAFINKMEEVIYSFDSKSKLVYVHMDIAHFKYINEAHGYDMGDRILKCFADLACGNSSEILCATRIHGDNLILVYVVPASVPDKAIISGINAKLQKDNAVLQSTINSRNFYINCGVCITDGSDHKYDRGITNANYAGKLAKENADGQCVWFDDEMFARQRKKMQLLDEFGEALKHNEFKVVYQPQIDSISKTVIAAEALSRWEKEDGTVLMPEEFVDILEDANKLMELDYYVMNKVLTFISGQIKDNGNIVPISMNLSRNHIRQENFFDNLQKLLDKYGVSPEYILFEIKEEVFINRINDAVLFCNRLRQMGIRVMMDSFGLGYSSLNALDKIPAECIKLDKIFIKESAFAKNEEVILNGIVDITKKLQKSIVSIGVETFEQNAFLCKCGCDMIQGNFYSEPLDCVKLAEYIGEHSVPEVNSAYFSFDGNFDADKEVYAANANGAFIGFDENILSGRKVLNLPGGLTGHEMVELSLGNLLANDFTISMWFYEREVNMWSSLFYADFDNAFVSLMPKAWNGMSLMRVMDKTNEAGFYDAISNVNQMDGWTQIAAVYNSVTHSSAIFINGFLAGYKNDILPLQNPGRITLGGDIYQPSFNGYVADLRVTNRAMSAKDVKKEYEQSRNEFRKNNNKRR